MGDALARALQRLETWPRPVRWPLQLGLSAAGFAAGTTLMVAILIGTVTAFTVAGLCAGALWRWLTG